MANLNAYTSGICYFLTDSAGGIYRAIPKQQMKIEEAMLYCLAERNGGMKAEQLCDKINRERLHVRRDGKPGCGW